MAKAQGFSINPESQGGLLKYAMNKPGSESTKPSGGDSSDEELDVSKFGNKKEAKDLKEKRKAEIEALKSKG